MLTIIGIVLICVGVLGLLNLFAITLPAAIIIIVVGVLLAVFGGRARV